MDWRQKAIRHLKDLLKNNEDWKELYKKCVLENTVGIHLAVFSEPFLTLLLEGKKKVESRFTKNRVAPFGRIVKGDIVLVKKSGGPIIGFFICGEPEFFSNLNKKMLSVIEQDYGHLIYPGARNRDFWHSKANVNYATLLDVKKVEKIEPYEIDKADRTAWAVLQPSSKQPLFDL